MHDILPPAWLNNMKVIPIYVSLPIIDHILLYHIL